MKFWKRKEHRPPTLQELVFSEDDLTRLFAKSLLNLQVRAEVTEGNMLEVTGRVDLLEGRDNRNGSLRGESFQQLHNELTVLKRQVEAIKEREREQLEAAVGL